jgi:hypothetical protein
MRHRVLCVSPLCILLLAVLPARPQAQGLPSHVVINADYPKSALFRVSLFGTDVVRTEGKVPGRFSPQRQSFNGSIDVWLDGLDGDFRIYRSKGTLEMHETAGGRTQIKPVQAGGRIEFDRLGYPKKSPSDPADLIPIFPPKPVAAGEHWTAKALITEPFGTGEAVYTYTVEAISLAENGHILATIRFNVAANVDPPPALKGWVSTLTGHGRLDWDTEWNQRDAGSYHIAYSAVHENSGIFETREMTEHVVKIK